MTTMTPEKLTLTVFLDDRYRAVRFELQQGPEHRCFSPDPQDEFPKAWNNDRLWAHALAWWALQMKTGDNRAKPSLTMPSLQEFPKLKDKFRNDRCALTQAYAENHDSHPNISIPSLPGKSGTVDPGWRAAQIAIRFTHRSIDGTDHAIDTQLENPRFAATVSAGILNHFRAELDPGLDLVVAKNVKETAVIDSAVPITKAHLLKIVHDLKDGEGFALAWRNQDGKVGVFTEEHVQAFADHQGIHPKDADGLAGAILFVSRKGQAHDEKVWMDLADRLSKLLPSPEAHPSLDSVVYRYPARPESLRLRGGNLPDFGRIPEAPHVFKDFEEACDSLKSDPASPVRQIAAVLVSCKAL